MASKKKEYNVTGQAMSFISQPQPEAPETEPVDTDERTHEIIDSMAGQAIKAQRRRVNPGKMWRVNLLLDADLQEKVMIQALREGKNISVFVNEILHNYINEHLKV